jgi:hypothetical protein
MKWHNKGAAIPVYKDRLMVTTVENDNDEGIVWSFKEKLTILTGTNDKYRDFIGKIIPILFRKSEKFLFVRPVLMTFSPGHGKTKRVWL